MLNVLSKTQNCFTVYLGYKFAEFMMVPRGIPRTIGGIPSSNSGIIFEFGLLSVVALFFSMIP